MENVSNCFRPKGHYAIWTNRACRISFRVKEHLTCNYYSSSSIRSYYSSTCCQQNMFYSFFLIKANSYPSALWGKKPVTETSEMSLGVGESGEYLLNPEKKLHFFTWELIWAELGISVAVSCKSCCVTLWGHPGSSSAHTDIQSHLSRQFNSKVKALLTSKAKQEMNSRLSEVGRCSALARTAGLQHSDSAWGRQAPSPPSSPPSPGFPQLLLLCMVWYRVGLLSLPAAVSCPGCVLSQLLVSPSPLLLGWYKPCSPKTATPGCYWQLWSHIHCTKLATWKESNIIPVKTSKMKYL